MPHKPVDDENLQQDIYRLNRVFIGIAQKIAANRNALIANRLGLNSAQLEVLRAAAPDSLDHLCNSETSFVTLRFDAKALQNALQMTASPQLAGVMLNLSKEPGIAASDER